MTDFGSAINAQLAGRDVRASVLVSVEFDSGTMRLWLGGAGMLTTPAGGGTNTWAGIGTAVDIDELMGSVGDAVEPFDLTLSGVDGDVLSIVTAGVDESYDKLVVVYLQFFDEDWSPLDEPFPIAWGRTSNLVVSESGGNSQSGPVRSVRAPIEPILSGRFRPRHVHWSDRDQKIRFPGDKGCERMPVLTMQTIRWPDFT